MRSYTLLICIFYFTQFAIAQQIKGTVIDVSGDTIPKATLLLKKAKNSGVISEFLITDSNGVFNYTLKKQYGSILYIEAKALNYEAIVDSVVNPDPSKVYQFNFALFPKANKLEEVIISERKKFTIKKDTVVFNVDKYKDGTERMVEDVIKKLPGVEVGDNGRISYKGKEVSAVNLDGDDLFGSKYTIGTKNISIDMVDQIEAIENYSKNPLLKDIENSDRVALNLKLKKNRADYSGTADLGYGYGDKSYSDSDITLLGVSASLKSFGQLSLSNTGNYDMLTRSSGSIVAIENENEDDIYSTTLINNAPINSVLGYKRSRVDEQLYGTYNVLYKFSNRAKLKSNIVYLKDNVFQQELYQNDFFFNDEQFSYTDITEICQKPQAKGLDIKFTYNVSKNSLLEIDAVLSKNQIASTANFIRDLSDNTVTGLDTEDFMLKHKINYTYRINKTTAVQFISLYAKNDVPQRFSTFGNFFTEQEEPNSYDQFTSFMKESFQNRVVLLGRKKSIKYAIATGISIDNNPFTSFLNENDTQIEGIDNDFNYERKEYFSIPSLTYTKRDIEVKPSVSFSYITQQLNYDTSSNDNLIKNDWFIQPVLDLEYKINPVSTIGFRGSYELNTPDEQFLIRNRVIIDNRTAINSIPSLLPQKKQQYSFNYRLSNLYRNIELFASVGYNRNENIFLSDLNVNTNYTGVTYFQSPTALNAYILSLSAERYLRFIQTTVKLSSLYSISEFQNVISGNSRDGESNFWNNTIFAKTAFRIPFNFENYTTFSLNSYFIDGQEVNSNKGFKNSLKAIFKPVKGWVGTITYDYFKPNTESKEDFSFIDFEIRHKPKKIKWISGRLTGRNLLNNRVFSQVQNSDFSTTIYQSNLIPRYVMLSLDLSF